MKALASAVLLMLPSPLRDPPPPTPVAQAQVQVKRVLDQAHMDAAAYTVSWRLARRAMEQGLSPTRVAQRFVWLKRYIARYERKALRQAKLAVAIALACERHRLDHTVFARILAQESRFKHGAVNRGSGDYGLGQVNWKTWGHALKLDKKLLQWDDEYGIDVAAYVLASYRKSYAKLEENWWSRYHSATLEKREVYETLVLAKT